jgi:hypothetical protein
VTCPEGQIALAGGFSASLGVAITQFARIGTDGWIVTASVAADQPPSVVVVKVYCTS